MRIVAPNYTMTPNDLFDHWLPHLGEAELKVLLVIMRKTFGWHKQRDRISISQLAHLTGMLEETVVKASRSLQNKGVIKKEVIGPKGKQETYYELIIHDESNNSYPSVNPSTPLGLDPHGSTESQKKPFSPKETTTTKEKASPAVAVFSNSSKEEKQRQQSGNSEELKIYPCLQGIDEVKLPMRDKIKLTERYLEEVVENAVKWTFHPETKIKQSLGQAIWWACDAQPKIPVDKEEQCIINRCYAHKFDGTSCGGYYIYAMHTQVELTYPQSPNSKPVILCYEENDFIDKFDAVLKNIKLGRSPNGK